MNMPNQHTLQSRLGQVAFALSLLLTGCVQATASVPEVEVARENLVFQGLPAGTPTSVPPTLSSTIAAKLPANIPPELAAQLPPGLSTETLSQLNLPNPDEAYHFPTMTFSYSRVPADLPTGLTSRMHVRDVTIRAHEGYPSLAFVRGILLTVSKPNDPTSPPRVLLQYPTAGIEETPIDRSVTLPVLDASGAINPWENDDSVYTLDVWADLAQIPQQAWSVDVILRLRGSVEFEF